MKRIIVLSGTFAVLVGCSHPAIHVTKAPDPQLPGGWTLADDTQDGIKLGIPGGWHEGVDTTMSGISMANDIANDPSSQGMDPNSGVGALGEQMKRDDSAEQKAGLAKLREKGVVINVIDSSKPTPGEVRNQFYVKKIDHSGNWTMDMAKDDEIEVYKGSGADAPKEVSLPIGKAYRFASDHKTRGGDEVQKISFVMVDGKETYVLRFISTNNPDAVKSIADDVAKTWRIKPGTG